MLLLILKFRFVQSCTDKLCKPVFVQTDFPELAAQVFQNRQIPAVTEKSTSLAVKPNFTDIRVFLKGFFEYAFPFVSVTVGLKSVLFNGFSDLFGILIKRVLTETRIFSS